MRILLILSVLAVVFVNGWTDAPNAIATAVSTRCLRVKSAIFLAAVCNLAGIVLTTLLHGQVANTVSGMLDFTSGNTDYSIAALFAGMCAVALFSFAAWIFGIPTSESHGLIAGITGAAVYLNGLSAIRVSKWSKIFTGLIISVALGFLLGYFSILVVRMIGKHIKKEQGDRFFYRGEQWLAAAMAFVHGAQDGQKFVGVFLIASMLLNGQNARDQIAIKPEVLILIAVVLFAGTLLGGGRIIKSVGFGITPLSRYEGFCADLASVCSLAISTWMGLPVSTTHVKTMAVVAVGFSDSTKRVEIATVKQMILAWIITFPCCMVLGYVVTAITLRFLI